MPLKPLQVAQGSLDLKQLDKIESAVRFLEENYEIRISEHDPSKITIRTKGETYYDYPPTLDDISLHLIKEGISLSDTILRKIVRSPNYIKPYNPITEYFDSIRGKYEGTSHIDTFCRHVIPRTFDDNTEEHYRLRTDRLIKKWFVACVACWLDGNPNPVALGFIHPREGIGKTYLTEFIIPEPLKEYYIKSRREDKFDIEDAFTRYMIINFDELVGLANGTIDLFKKSMTERSILIKRRYEEFAIPRTRIACATFTSNRNAEAGGFLKEGYGYRRFGAIEITEINHEYSTLCDVNQMWAEALNLYENTEFDWNFTLEDFDEFEQYNAKYIVETPAMKYARLYLSTPTIETLSQAVYLNATEVVDLLRKNHKIRTEDTLHVTPQKMGRALAALGFSQKSDRQGTDIPLKRYHLLTKF